MYNGYNNPNNHPYFARTMPFDSRYRLVKRNGEGDGGRSKFFLL